MSDASTFWWACAIVLAAIILWLWPPKGPEGEPV